MIPVLFTEVNAAIPSGPVSEGPTPTDMAGLSDFMLALAPPVQQVPKPQINRPGPDKTDAKVGQATPVVKILAGQDIPETSSPLTGEAPSEPLQVSDPDDPQNAILPLPDPLVAILYPPQLTVPPAWFFTQMPAQSVGPDIAAGSDPVGLAQRPQDSTRSGDHSPASWAVNAGGQRPEFGSAAALATDRDGSGDVQNSGNSPQRQTALIALASGNAPFDALAIRPARQDASSNTAPNPEEIQISPAWAAGHSGSLQPTLPLGAVPNGAYVKDGDRTAPDVGPEGKAASHDSSRIAAAMWHIAASGLTTTRLTEPLLPAPSQTTQTLQGPTWAAVEPSFSPVALDSIGDVQTLASIQTESTESESLRVTHLSPATADNSRAVTGPDAAKAVDAVADDPEVATVPLPLNTQDPTGQIPPNDGTLSPAVASPPAQAFPPPPGTSDRLSSQPGPSDTDRINAAAPVILKPAGTATGEPTAKSAAPFQVSVTHHRNGSIEIVLKPSELGRVSFALSGPSDHLQIVLSIERPDTMDLLQRHSAHLLTELRQSGFNGTSLSFGRWGQDQGSAQSNPAPVPQDRPSIDQIEASPAHISLSVAGQSAGLNLRL